MRLMPDFHTSNMSLDFAYRFIRHRHLLQLNQKEFART
jgi:hypothetical protein